MKKIQATAVPAAKPDSFSLKCKKEKIRLRNEKVLSASKRRRTLLVVGASK